MKAHRTALRLEPRRTGNVLIIVSVLFSLCILSLIKARYCSAPYAKSHKWTEMESMEAASALIAENRGEAALSEDEEDEGNVAVSDRKSAEREEMKLNIPICSEINKRSNVCEADGDIRVQASSQSILLHPSLTDQEWRIKPYCRKHDPSAMKSIKDWTIKPSPSTELRPKCTVNHTVPAMVFSIGGFTGNLFHDFTDVIIPLFVTAYQFRGEVQFVIADVKPWWLSRFALILKQLSNYEIIDASNDDPAAVRCFPHAIVGLRFQKELGVDPTRTPGGYSVIDFKEMLRRAYGLERPTAEPSGDEWDIRRKPRLLIITRRKSRAFLNERGMADMAMSLGFDVRAAEPDASTDLAKFARLVNSADVMLGVHGAGLTNMVFLPAGAVLVQLVQVLLLLKSSTVYC